MLVAFFKIGILLYDIVGGLWQEDWLILKRDCKTQLKCNFCRFSHLSYTATLILQKNAVQMAEIS